MTSDPYRRPAERPSEYTPLLDFLADHCPHTLLRLRA
jgi:hypothetical protein